MSESWIIDCGLKVERKNNNLIIIPKIEKYIEYMLTILLIV